MSKKKQRYCPYCQAKQRTIERLESRLWAYEIKKAPARSKTLNN